MLLCISFGSSNETENTVKTFAPVKHTISTETFKECELTADNNVH
jgi:hypothetical protein